MESAELYDLAIEAAKVQLQGQLPQASSEPPIQIPSRSL